MNRTDKETPTGIALPAGESCRYCGKTRGAAALGETVQVPIDEYGRGSYAQRELVDQLLAIDPRLKSVNLAL